MQEIKEIISTKITKNPQKKLFRSEREELIESIYEVYLHNFADMKPLYKEYPIKKIIFFLSHVKTSELYYVLSQCKEMAVKKYLVGGYLTNLSHKK